MFRKCAHEWEKLAETTIQSAWDEAKEKIGPGSVSLNIEFWRKKYILILQCKKCGALDKTIEVN